jgi:hypothetical protein
MGVEKVKERATEILIETAASFDRQSEDYIESDNRFSREYAVAAELLQRAAYKEMRDLFRRNHKDIFEWELKSAIIADIRSKLDTP